MDNSRTVRHGNIAVAGHIMAFLFLFYGSFSGAGKQRLVFLIFQIFSRVSFKNLIGRLAFLTQLSEHGVKKRLCHVISASVRRFYLRVGFFRVHAQRHVRGQRPRRGCPCQEKSVLAHHFEANHRRAFLYRLIALRHLMGRERRPASGAIGHNLKALI